MNIVAQVSRVLVGALFIFSGLIKLNDPVGTAIKMDEYFGVFANDFAPFFAVFKPFALEFAMLVVVLEVVLGVAVLLNYKMNLTAWVLLLLIVFFTFLTFYSAWFNKVTDCGCFGDAIKLTPWESFTKDVILLFFVGIIFFFRNQYRAMLPEIPGHLTMGGVTALSIFVGFYAIQHLPYLDFRAYKVGTDIEAAMNPSEELKYKYVMEKDGEIHEFAEYPSEPGYEYKDYVLLNPEAQAKITDYSVWNNEGDFTKQTFMGSKLVVIVHDSDKADGKSLKEINALVEKLPTNVEALVFTATGEEKFEAFRHEHQIAMPYYFADATVLKAVIRSNPGIVLMHEGTVQGKWHHNDVPDITEISNLLEQGIANR